ncbi:hypothetical protein CONLIGDRAFT_719428 [Coniochaeta ligniaria NRRL 30616]|uniref:Uncharacterized protein n=1 Tax=Coniochaeta ligniaria NRRL 30616 TaxID=1408157 RepID=A0A1J7J1W2_9PEZI|nr:hypothetical protein CONLIGDRAFT_719428 [Coniochaeta ligniaria NRRL 30616]
MCRNNTAEKICQTPVPPSSGLTAAPPILLCPDLLCHLYYQLYSTRISPSETLSQVLDLDSPSPSPSPLLPPTPSSVHHSSSHPSSPSGGTETQPYPNPEKNPKQKEKKKRQGEDTGGKKRGDNTMLHQFLSELGLSQAYDRNPVLLKETVRVNADMLVDWARRRRHVLLSSPTSSSPSSSPSSYSLDHLSSSGGKTIPHPDDADDVDAGGDNDDGDAGDDDDGGRKHNWEWIALPQSWRDFNINLENTSFESDMRLLTSGDLVARSWGEVWEGLLRRGTTSGGPRNTGVWEGVVAGTERERVTNGGHGGVVDEGTEVEGGRRDAVRGLGGDGDTLAEEFDRGFAGLGEMRRDDIGHARTAAHGRGLLGGLATPRSRSSETPTGREGCRPRQRDGWPTSPAVSTPGSSWYRGDRGGGYRGAAGGYESEEGGVFGRERREMRVDHVAAEVGEPETDHFLANVPEARGLDPRGRDAMRAWFETADRAAWALGRGQVDDGVRCVEDEDWVAGRRELFRRLWDAARGDM